MDQIESKAKLVGVLPLIKYYMDQLRLGELLDRYLPKPPNMQLRPAQVLSVMVMNIITAATPLYKIHEWVADYLDGLGEPSAEANQYNDDQLGRNLDRLYRADRQSLMCELAANAIVAYQLQTRTIHNDSTTITFKGRYDHQIDEAVKLRLGHNKDFRPDCLQIVYGLNITADGNVPLSFDLFDGNQTDDNTHVPNWERLRQMLATSDFTYVADCKLCSRQNLDHIHQNGGRFVTVVPKNRSILKPFAAQLEAGQVQWTYAYSIQNNRKPSRQDDFHTFEAAATEQGYRLIWVLSSAKAALDRKTRQRRLAKAEKALTDLRPRLNRYKLKTRSQIEAAVAKICRPLGDWLQVRVVARQTSRWKKISAGRPGPDSVYEKETLTTFDLQWQQNQQAIDKDALADGTFPLITNTDQDAAEVLRIYKQQPCLEKRFSTTKSVLEVAPVFLEKTQRIEAMVFLYFVALMIVSLMERAIRNQMAEQAIEKLPILPGNMNTNRPTWNNIRYLLRNVHHAQIFVNHKRVKQNLKGLDDIHTLVLRLLGVPPAVYWNLPDNWLSFGKT